MALTTDDVLEMLKIGGVGTAAALVGRSAWRQIHQGAPVSRLPWTWRFLVSELSVITFCGYAGVGIARWLDMPKDILWLPPLVVGYFGLKFLEDLILRYRDRELPKQPDADPEPPKE